MQDRALVKEWEPGYRIDDGSGWEPGGRKLMGFLVRMRRNLIMWANFRYYAIQIWCMRGIRGWPLTRCALYFCGAKMWDKVRILQI